MSVLHKTWLERYVICHERTNNVIRVENHNTLRSNVLKNLDMHDELPNELETHRGKVDLMSSELLRAFLHEFCTIINGISSSTQLTNHTLNAATYCRPDITLEASELRDAASKIRHVTVHKSKQLWFSQKNLLSINNF